MESVININNASFEKNTRGFLLGILIYSISATLIFDWYPKTWPGALVNFVQLIGLGMFTFYWIRLASWKNVPNIYLRVMTVLIIGWELFIVYHGFVFDYELIKENFFVNNRSIAYLLPLAIFIPIANPIFLRKIFKYIYIINLFFLFLLPFLWTYILDNQDVSEQYVWILGLGSGFTLLTLFYRPKKEVIIAFIVMVLSLLIVTIMGRRNIMLSCINFLFFSLLIIPLLYKNLSFIKKSSFILFFICTLFIGLNIYTSNQTSLFYHFTKRATDDTREKVFLFYFLDMSDQDLLIGKGLNGTYYCPDVDRNWGGEDDPKHRDLDYRVYIENAFLQLILNGGIIYLLLYLLILIPAVVLGLFFSKNIFVKGCALLVFLFIVDMIPFGLPTFSLRHFIVWFCVGICYNKEMRIKSENEIRKLFISSENEIINNEDTITDKPINL